MKADIDLGFEIDAHAALSEGENTLCEFDCNSSSTRSDGSGSKSISSTSTSLPAQVASSRALI